mgnify:FL=1
MLAAILVVVLSLLNNNLLWLWLLTQGFNRFAGVFSGRAAVNYKKYKM